MNSEKNLIFSEKCEMYRNSEKFQRFSDKYFHQGINNFYAIWLPQIKILLVIIIFDFFKKKFFDFQGGLCQIFLFFLKNLASLRCGIDSRC